MNFAKQIKTKQGEIVKSNYEKDVANYLYDNGVEYIYEDPLKMSNGLIIHPDFYLPGYDVYIEVYGMWGSAKYSKDRAKKQLAYDQDDIKVIELWFGGGRANFKFHLERQFKEFTGIPFPTRKVQQEKTTKENINIFEIIGMLFGMLHKLFIEIIKTLKWFGKQSHAFQKFIIFIIVLLILATSANKKAQNEVTSDIPSVISNALEKNTQVTQNRITEPIKSTVPTKTTELTKPKIPTKPIETIKPAAPTQRYVEIAKYANEEFGQLGYGSFNVTSGRFKIQYDCENKNDTAFLREVEGIGIWALKGSNRTSDTVEFRKTGEYYIHGYFAGKCTFTVYEYK
ncbi:hypothetical protein JW758_01400 [Candidatus Peregrinibacteria bacterium]|nr:hypothetical protein [Candidatus Peregrinibacteria bacterium]